MTEHSIQYYYNVQCFCGGIFLSETPGKVWTFAPAVYAYADDVQYRRMSIVSAPEAMASFGLMCFTIDALSG